MSFLHLPNEIVLLIAKEVEHIPDINALSQTNRYFAAFLASVLIDAVFHTQSEQYSRKLLYSLAERGDVTGVEALLDRGIKKVIHSEHSAGPSSAHLLCDAASDCEVTAVRTLMRAGLCPNAQDIHGETPLFRAAASGKVATVRALLEDPTVDVELYSWNRLKPLHVAAFSGHVEVVRVLLSDPRIDVNSRARTYDTTALHEAVSASREDVVRVLLGSDRIDPNLLTGLCLERNRLARYHPCTPLHLAAARGMHTIARILVNDSRVNVNTMDSRHRTPLHIAIEWGYTATIQLLDSRSPYGVRRSGFGDRQPCKYNLRGATLSKPR